MFQRLAVFVSGFTLEAAERVCNAEGDLTHDMLDTVSSLVDKSLLSQMPTWVRPEEMADGETRFGMLQTIREFGLELLEELGEAESVRARHAEYYRALAMEAEPKLTTAQQGEWLNRLDAEAGNLRAAMEWLAQSGSVTEGSQMGGALWRFWSTRGRLTEGRRQLEAVLAQGAMTDSHERDALQARAKALHGAGTLCAQQGDYDQARAYYEESLGIRRRLGEKQGIANLLNNLGVLARWQGDYPRARTLFEESLDLLRQLDDRPVTGSVLNNLGLVMQNLREYEHARALLEESLATRRALGDQWGIANSLNSLGEVLLDQGDYAAAGPALTESLALYRRLGDPRAIAFVLEGLGALAAVQAQPERALTLAGAARALRQDINAPLSPEEQAALDRRLSSARAALAPAAQEAATRAGMDLSLEQALQLALRPDV